MMARAMISTWTKLGMLMVFLIASLLQSPELANFSFTATWCLNYFDRGDDNGDSDGDDDGDGDDVEENFIRKLPQWSFSKGFSDYVGYTYQQAITDARR